VWLNNTPDGARPSLTSFADDVIELHRLERNDRIEKRLEVVKASCSAQSAGLHPYEIGEQGFQLVKRDDDQSTNGHVDGYDGKAVTPQRVLQMLSSARRRKAARHPPPRPRDVVLVEALRNGN
jgi:hypothetical protein